MIKIILLMVSLGFLSAGSLIAMAQSAAAVTSPDLPTAIRNSMNDAKLLELAEQGDIEVQFYLAKTYLLARNQQQAEIWNSRAEAAIAQLTKKAEQGDSYAQFDLAQHFEIRDKAQAEKWYNKAAQQNHSRALLHMATRDHQRAVEYFKQAAADDEPLSQYKLACTLTSSNGDITIEGRRLLEKVVCSTYIARKGIGYKASDGRYKEMVERCKSKAAYKLGVMHEKGLGDFPISHARAAEFYKKSLEFNSRYDKALISLASLYYHGEGVSQDTIEAARLLRLLPDSNVEGQNLLGDIYTSGHYYAEASICYENALKYMYSSGNP